MVRTGHEPAGRASGYSLIEALVVIALIALAVAFAIPNLQRTRLKSTAKLGLRQVQGVLDMARNESLKRHTPVGVSYAAATRTFTMFDDWSGTTANALDSGDERIEERELDPFLIWEGATPDQPAVFAPDGRLQSPAGGIVARLSDVKGNQFRFRIIDATGSIMMEGVDRNGNWSRRDESWVWNY